MSMRRTRLAISASRGVAAVGWQRVRAKLGRRQPPLATSVMMHRLDSFVTWHDRPKSPAAATSATGAPPVLQTAIVIQGPVMEESDFTVNNVIAYRAAYPETPVVVSTWRGTAQPVIDALEEAGAVVVTSDPPTNPGIRNINMQIVSVRAGVEAVVAAGAEYVLKTRSDQRLYSPKALQLLRALVDQFPIGEHCGTQQQRIVTTDRITAKYVPYVLSDFITFGTAADVLAYWSPPLDQRSGGEVRRLPGDTPREVAARRACEPYLCARFLASTGWEPTGTLEDWWRALAERFVIVDTPSLDLFWPKYSMREFRYTDYADTVLTEGVSMGDWLALMNDPSLSTITVPEGRLDERTT